MMDTDSSVNLEDCAMSATPSFPTSLRDCFHDLPDPRREHGRLHSLWDIVGLTLCATICGCDTVVEIHKYGVIKREFLSEFLDFEHGVPSHDTIGRVLARLDPEKFRAAFATWTQRLAQSLDGQVVAIDGKSLRGAHDADTTPLHLVSAYATENRLVLTQRAVDATSNEIVAIPAVLKLLDVKKAVVTIDAMGCQKAIASQIVQQGGDDVLALKDNQPTRQEDVAELFEPDLDTPSPAKQRQVITTEDEGHGRHETRVYTMVRLTQEFLSRHPEWNGLKTVGMVRSERTVGRGETTTEVRYFISSLSLKVAKFAHAVRSHWRIENNLHWVIDVGFREDESRVRTDHAPENLAWVRRIAANLLAKDDMPVGTAAKRKIAGWNDEHLLTIVGHALS
jgi:predicted transposase YbfD/YdcC